MPIIKKLADQEYVTNVVAEAINNAKPDWNQIDEAAQDYIKNRTHWIEKKAVVALQEGEFDVRNGSVDIYEVEVNGLTPNARCLVTIDGVSYESDAYHGVFNAYEWYVIGNGELIGETSSNTDVPFGIFIDKYNENYMQLADNKTGTVTLKIEVIGDVVHKIPEMYLPEKIGANGSGSYAEVFNDLTNNIASGDYSHAENFKATASGYASHAEGLSNQATGYGSHAEGTNTAAKGAYAHTEGYYTVANGSQSHAEGEGTIADGKSQHVSGKYNVANSSDLVIVGNGAGENNRRNAYRLDINGNGYFAGNVHANGDKKVATEKYVDDLYKKLTSNTVLRFYCIEDVTISLNGVSTVYPANSNVEIKFLETDVFEIIPTSDNSILSLNAFPGALGTYYSWLEGVKQFSNILFNMNPEDMYTKWSQGNQGAYQVQFAQYLNCIFWSDNPYVSEVSKRTNYTLYYTSQLPLCYSTIPDNTFKAFYLAFNVTSDPNWGNKAYRDSFAKATWATQVFSYYGARTIGIFGHDSNDFNIVLPEDCRGLMSGATAIENAGTFDAINTTNFGASSGSWRDAFGWCSSLRNLYIKNLKVNLNVSWSPINYDSIYFIISEATNTNAITISVSPYTYNLLGQSDFELATSKNITIELLTTNYVEDRRLSAISTTGDGSQVLSNDGTYKALPTKTSQLENDNGFVNSNDALLKTSQTLTDAELTQVRSNLKFIGKDVAGQKFTVDGKEVTASANAEIFGDYVNNIALGQWSIAEGSGTLAQGRASHVEGAYGQALADGTHVEGYGCKASGYWSHAEGEMTVVSSYASHAEGSYCTMPDGAKRYSTAAGYASHTEGGGCHTTGVASHAEGIGTTANGRCAHVEGVYTVASGKNQHVEGVANIEDTEDKYIHIAGNGTLPTDRSNAYTLDWNGNAWFAGNVEATAIILRSSTEGSTKTFKLTINDSGELSISENV